MESIRNSDFSVISMNEFLEWRFGTRLLPEKCILITLDDGWRSVYTDAFPIFKEYGYPFHLFLYTTYLTGSGDSMTHDMIREMMQHGATIGSHSATHPYPADWKRAQAKGEEAYTTMIKQEIGETRQKLSDIFEPVSTYCYPGGYNDAAMQNILQEYGYVAAFTVIPGKVSHNEAQIPLCLRMPWTLAKWKFWKAWPPVTPPVHSPAIRRNPLLRLPRSRTPPFRALSPPLLSI